MQELWEERVRPADRDQLEEPEPIRAKDRGEARNKHVKQTGKEAARLRRRAAAALNEDGGGGDGGSAVWVNPFKRCNVMANTSVLWGRGVVQVCRHRDVKCVGDEDVMSSAAL